MQKQPFRDTVKIPMEYSHNERRHLQKNQQIIVK